MARLFVAAALAAALLACGNPCTHVAGAEQAANDKGKACNSSNTSWDDARIKRCSDGLSKCSADDMKWAETYADCLRNLPVCQEGQAFSWGLQRFGCGESLLKISGTCLNAIN